MRPKAKISQLHIALEVGLSQGLVSRILNGHRQHISPETYDRVWERALALGYRPKGMRTLPVTDAPSPVGLILRSGMNLTTHSNYYSHVQAGLMSVLATHKTGLTLLGTEDSFIPAVAPPLPDRVVILGEPEPAFVRWLRQHTKLVVAVGAGRHGWCHTICSNEQQSLGLLVAHLQSLGHRRIGWIGGDPDYARHRERLNAFRETLAIRGLRPLRVRDCSIVKSGARITEGRIAIQRLVGNRAIDDRPSAVVAYNGTMARGAINELLQGGWEIPAQLSIAAVDVSRVCIEDTPTITGASAIPEELGKAAAHLLLQNSNSADHALQHVEINAYLRVGDSTGAAPKFGRDRKRSR